MHRSDFVSRWHLADRRAQSLLWMFYPCGMLTCIALVLTGFVGLFIPELRFAGAGTIAGALAGLAALRLAELCWCRWLRKIGMVCGACSHVLICHTGTRLDPHRPGFCTVCSRNGPCRRVCETGECDHCGATIFIP